MDQRLKEAAEAGDIKALYVSIRQDPKVLELIEEIPFIDTPLHIAASAGHTHFAMEIIRLKPSFGRKLNPDGLSPLDLALQNGHSDTVKRLVNFDSELIRVQGREGITPLHYVAETDDTDHLAEFLYACPASIKDLTIRNESVVHVALKNLKLRAFNVLFGWLRRTYQREVLNWRDDEGNTVLHITVSTNQPEVVKKLINDKVKTDVKNSEGLTPLDMASILPMDADNKRVREILHFARAPKASSLANVYSLAEFLISPERFYERMTKVLLHRDRILSMEIRNVVLVVAVLLATATFQAALSPPGGLSQGSQCDNNAPNTTTNSSSNVHHASPAGGIGHGYGNNISGLNPVIRISLRQHQSSNVTAAGKVVMSSEDFFVFYLFNTITFIASIMVIGFTIQLRHYIWLLDVCLFFLVWSYGYALLIISPSPWSATLFNVISWSVFPVFYLGKYVIYVLKNGWSGSNRERPIRELRLQMLRNMYGRNNIAVGKY